METLGLKNVNMLSKEQYEGISIPATDELYAISGSGFGFPSNNYEDLELGASGTTYTAPANGYFLLVKAAASTNQYITFMNSTRGYSLISYCPASSGTLRMIFPVQKGDKVPLNYNVSGATTSFRFIYAEGE